MAKRVKDTDYLSVSAEIRSLEKRLLTAGQAEQLLGVATAEETARLLREWGYEGIDPRRPETLDVWIDAKRQALLTELENNLPEAETLNVFRLPYDYHNLKVLLKAEAMQVNAERLLSHTGRVKVNILTDCIRDGRTEELPPHLAEAAAEGKAALENSHDPRRCDMAIDRRCGQDLQETAEAAGSAFLQAYAAVQTDAVNLRTLVRALRMKQADLLKEALLEGGRIDTESLKAIAAEGGAGLAARYDDTHFSRAAELGEAALRGSSLTAFEKACDDAVAAYLAAAQFVPFGEELIPAYLAAKEREWTDLRIILMGKQAGLDGDTIRSRLRSDER